MMRSLNTLIRLQQRELEQLRRRLAALQERRDALTRQDELLVQALQDELALAASMPTVAHFFSNFSAHTDRQRQSLAKEMAKMDRTIEQVKQQVMDVFAELKKYEIALEQHQKRLKEQQARREQQQMDEIAAYRHRNAHMKQAQEGNTW